jgi:hypothetical protein
MEIFEWNFYRFIRYKQHRWEKYNCIGPIEGIEPAPLRYWFRTLTNSATKRQLQNSNHKFIPSTITDIKWDAQYLDIYSYTKFTRKFPSTSPFNVLSSEMSKILNFLIHHHIGITLVFIHRLIHSFTISFCCFHESMYQLNERTNERLNVWMKEEYSGIFIAIIFDILKFRRLLTSGQRR